MIAKAAAFFGLEVEDNVVAFNCFVDDVFFSSSEGPLSKRGTALGSNGNGGGRSSFP